MKTIEDLKQALKEAGYRNDAWGIAVSALFQISAHAYEQGDCPAEWGFRLGMAGNYIDPEDSFTEFLTGLSYDNLILLGNYCNRLCNRLKLAGKSY